MKKFPLILFAATAFALAQGCGKSELPVVTTSAVSGITQSSAVCGGNVTSDGGAAIKSKGVCWGTAPNPTIIGKKTDEGKGAGSFSSTLMALLPSTTYYVRAYATNKAGTAYGNEVVFSTNLTDPDGNVYQTIAVGSQVWMAENLRTTKYSNGTDISYPGSDDNEWYNNASGAYAWYDNDSSHKQTYGALYKWSAVSNLTGLCPTGWHVPTDEEWDQLVNALGGETQAGGKLKETGTLHWFSPNTGATDEVGFAARPSGSRNEMGSYANLGYNGYWWTSTPYNMGNAWCRIISSSSASVTRIYSNKGFGYSVRCVKNP